MTDVAVVQQLRERRFYPRVPCKIPDAENQVIRNISHGGLYLESGRSYRPHENLAVTFTLPPAKMPMKLAATVVRQEKLGPSRYGYGLKMRDLKADEYEQIHYFTTRAKRPNVARETKILYRTFAIETRQQNLTSLDPRLAEYVRPTDYFYIHNLTDELREFVRDSGINDGTLTAQILHTSATLLVNELDEPMLLMDLAKKLRGLAPKDADYFHNGPMRKMNVCKDDAHCDRNGDAHVRASLFGHPSVTLLVRKGDLVLGQWQRVALLEFDGPRKREVLVQVMGAFFGQGLQ